MAGYDHGGVMKKLISIIAIALLQSACTSTGQHLSQEPLISFEQIGQEISVSQVVLTEDTDSSASIAAN